jgi:acyl carrier protein
MDPETLRLDLQGAFRRAFFADDLVLAPAMTAADVDGWDSLSHVRLLLEVERTFRIRFHGSEGTRLKDAGELMDLVASKLASGQ